MMETNQKIVYEEPVRDRTDELIVQSLARLDGEALGIALGLLFGIAIFAATNLLIYKGGDVIGPNMALLGQFFIGYEVSFTGSLIGMVYGLIAGLAIGWLIAFFRNLLVTIYMYFLKLKGSVSAVNDYIDNP